MPEVDLLGVPASPGTPYLTPAMLIAAPTGIQWSTVGAVVRPTLQQQTDEQINICRRSTSLVDGYCNQPLRATIDYETLYGPGDFRFEMLTGTGVARLLLSRSPIIAVLSGQVSATAAFPAQWNPLPASNWKIEKPVIGVYGTTSPGGSGDGGAAVLLAPGGAGWRFGRKAYQVQVTYINGWPHGSLAAAAAAGDTSISIDDCTGWGPPPGSVSGATGAIEDPGRQEVITATAASATSGPGLLTLSVALSYGHPAGAMVTTLPQAVTQAAILLSIAQALARGATATTIQAPPGRQVSEGNTRMASLTQQAWDLLTPYRRVI